MTQKNTEQSLPKITIRVFVLGVLLSIILAAANAYLGLFASGLITREALMGIVLAIPIILFKQHGLNLPLWEFPYGGGLGVILLVAAALWL